MNIATLARAQWGIVGRTFIDSLFELVDHSGVSPFLSQAPMNPIGHCDGLKPDLMRKPYKTQAYMD